MLLCSSHVQAQSTETNRENPQLNSTYEEPLVTRLEIERAIGSEACPNVDAVLGAIARLFPDRKIRRAIEFEPSIASIEVKIRPTLSGHEALVRGILPLTGERAIIENDVNCSGLAEALAVTLVMLIEPQEKTSGVTPAPVVVESALEASPKASPLIEQEREVPSITAEKPKKTPPSDTVVPRKVSRLVAEQQSFYDKSFVAQMSMATLGGIGLLSKPAMGGLVGVEFYHRSGWGLRLSGLRLWAMPANENGGSVNLTLWGTLGGPCYQKRLLTSSRIETCVLIGYGAERAKVDGFANQDSKRVPWAVLGPNLRYSAQIVKTVRGVFGVGAVGQLRPQSFSVTAADNPMERRTVAEAPRIGYLVEVGLTFGGVAF